MGKCNCGKRALYGFSYGEGIYCYDHKLAGMRDVTRKRCAHGDCDIRPTYDFPGKKGLFCVTHKLNGMGNISQKRCEYDECNTRPNFDFPGGRGRYCKNHKLIGMENIVSPRCAYSGCTKITPTFDYPGGKGTYCAEHKILGMIDVKNKRCAHPGCPKITPSFNFPGESGLLCAAHKLVGMIDVRHTSCIHTGCAIRPSYDYPGGIGAYCLLHKLVGMEDVRTPRCAYSLCRVLNPNFDIPGGKGKYCAAHKLEGMIDVKHKHCEHTGCIIRAYYGRPGSPPTHCAQHRQIGMIRRPTVRCTICKTNPAIYGMNFTPTHCEDHRTDTDVNLVERACVSCGLLYILDSNDRCELCNPESFTKARLQKQNALMAALDSRKDLPKPVSTDTLIDGGACGKERPDRVYDLGDKILILECDEHQHRDRQCLCEQTRMVNIAQSYGGIPVYFIRWNPDGYSPLNERKQLEILEKRHKMAGDLIRDINMGRHTPPVALCAAIYLYYDDWDGIQNESWKVLTHMIGAKS